MDCSCRAFTRGKQTVSFSRRTISLIQCNQRVSLVIVWHGWIYMNTEPCTQYALIVISSVSFKARIFITDPKMIYPTHDRDVCAWWLLIHAYPQKSFRFINNSPCGTLGNGHSLTEAFAIYSALLIYCGHCSSYNSWKRPHSSPQTARYGVSIVSANLTKVLSL